MNAIIAIGIFNIPVFARVSRSSFKSLAKRIYLSGSSSGKSDLRNIRRTYLPNIANLLIVQGTIQFSLALAEAGLVTWAWEHNHLLR